MAFKFRRNLADQDTQGTGTVKLYQRAHSFGFIVPDDGGNDVFVDREAVAKAGLEDQMVPGLRLTFDLVREKNGRRGCYQAINLAPLDILDDPATRIHQLENIIRQLFDALPAESREQMRPAVADIINAEQTAA